MDFNNFFFIFFIFYKFIINDFYLSVKTYRSIKKLGEFLMLFDVLKTGLDDIILVIALFGGAGIFLLFFIIYMEYIQKKHEREIKAGVRKAPERVKYEDMNDVEKRFYDFIQKAQ